MISSPANPRLRLVRRLAARRQRERLGLFVCEGEDLVRAALNAGVEPVHALVDGERPVLESRLPRAEPVAPGLLADVSALAHPPRVLAVFRRDDLPVVDAESAPAAGLALWRVGDPGNVGTLIRAADALGPAFVCLSDGCADPTGPKALRASAGAIFRVPLGGFGEAPGRRVALVPQDGVPLHELPLDGRVVFVLGAERTGLPEEILATCDEVASIPQAPAAESLNVAMAGTVALYERAARSAAPRPPEGGAR